MPGRQILSVTGQDDLRRLAADLRSPAIPRQVREDLRRELLALGRQGAAEVRAAVLATASKGQSGRRGRRSLRRKIASSVEVKVRTTRRPGVTIWTNPARMPPGEAGLPAYYEGLGRWRHPTFGSWSRTRNGRARAVTQRGKPYFYRTLNRLDLEAAGDRVLQSIRDRIE
jgi:hypothetical protein